MFNDTIKLVSYETATDEIGQLIQGDIIEREVLCKVKSVSRNEAYNSDIDGYRPELVFEINKLEYEGEEYLIYNDIKYKIMRTYLLNNKSYRKDDINWLDAKLELTVGRKLGNK